MIRRIGPTVFLLFWAFPPLWATPSTANISAGELKYQEESGILELSDSVSIKLDEVEILADKLMIDTHTEMAYGTGNILIRRGQDAFYSKNVRLDLNKNTVTLSNIDVTVSPPEMPQPIYIKADEIIDRPDDKSGSGATLTSCQLPDPHYFAWSQFFDYSPNHNILAINTFVYTPILGIPFGFWTPFYYYELGQRQIIWNIPTIGKREVKGWGWFIQNTIDYDLINDKSSSIFLDWYQNKGIGWGAKHNYKWKNIDGFVSFYRLDEEDTGERTERKGIESIYTDGPFTITGGLDSMDGKRLNSSGLARHDIRTLGVQYQDIEEVASIKFQNRDDYVSQTGSHEFSANYSFNNRQNFRLTQNESQYRASKTYRSNSTAVTSLEFPDRYTLTTEIAYDRDFSFNTSDDLLKLNASIKKNFAPGLNATLSTNYIWDLEGETVTRDTSSGRNNVLTALPKLNINYIDPTTFPVQLTHDLTIARLQEINYLVEEKTLRTYPKNDKFTVEPNTILYKLNATNTINDPILGTMTTRVGYSQQLFKNPDRNWTDSDAGYSLEFSESISHIHLGFIKTQTTYTNRYTPKENNSPYITLNLANIQQNDIAGSIRFFFDNETQYYWHNESRFNWINNRWDLYTTELGYKPGPVFIGTLRTGKLLNPQGFEIDNQYKPLDIALTSSPANGFNFGYSLSLDLNKYINYQTTEILQSQLNGQFLIGTDPEYQWEIRGSMRYNLLNQNGNYDFRRYEFETISIVKHDHCRLFQFGYNKLSEEYTFQVTIKAFPNDMISVRKTRENWKLQGGALSDTLQERL